MPRLPRTPRTPRVPGVGLGMNDVPNVSDGDDAQEARVALFSRVVAVGSVVSALLVLVGGLILAFALFRATGGSVAGVAGGLGTFGLLLCGGALLAVLLVVAVVWWLVRLVLGLVRGATGGLSGGNTGLAAYDWLVPGFLRGDDSRGRVRNSRAGRASNDSNPLGDLLDRFLR